MNLWDVLFPKSCVGCGKWGGYICGDCRKNIEQAELVCPLCERSALGGMIHPLCRRKYGLDGLWSLGAYRGVLRLAIQKLKYRYVAELAKVLMDLMVEYWAKSTPLLIEEIKKDGGEGWAVVPIPLHQKRQNMRGFNQSELLGRLLSKKLGLGYWDGIKRVRNTKPQVGLEGWERKKNIKQAFALNGKLKVDSYRFLLIDDVWTTGATMRECGYVLKRGGAKKVWAVTLAR